MEDAKLRERFQKDSAEVFLRTIAEAGKPITAQKVIASLVGRGLPEDHVRKEWKPFQRDILKFHPNIGRPHPKSLSYEWHQNPVAPDEALTRLLNLLATTSKTKAKVRDELVVLVRAGLGETLPTAPADDETKIQASQVRQSRIDSVRAIAELAGEIEELVYNTDDADIIVERLRTRVKAHSLEQIGQPGDETRFDPSQHLATGGRPDSGSPVSVVRPGYSWRDANETQILQRALVAAE